MTRTRLIGWIGVCTLCAACAAARAQDAPAAHVLPAPAAGEALAEAYASLVDRRLAVPVGEQAAYVSLAEAALARADIRLEHAQYVVVVDRQPRVQAVLVYWRADNGRWHFIGASPVSTGKRDGYEHFLTPLGVFDHSPATPDFRAEGTRNEFGIRGYGVKGMRVFDFGWVLAERTWGMGGNSYMRLQMHATDPDLLERRLGTPDSLGCIRIPASLNRFIDHYGLLDALYEAAPDRKTTRWLLAPDRTPTPWPGRYLIVVESERSTRPDWSPAPGGRSR